MTSMAGSVVELKRRHLTTISRCEITKLTKFEVIFGCGTEADDRNFSRSLTAGDNQVFLMTRRHCAFDVLISLLGIEERDATIVLADELQTVCENVNKVRKKIDKKEYLKTY